MYGVTWTDQMPEGTSAEGRADADSFYSPDWIEGVRSRWGSMPVKTEWEIPQVVESADGRIVTSDG
jgi:hypothetical protein